MSISDLFDSRV